MEPEEDPEDDPEEEPPVSRDRGSPEKSYTEEPLEPMKALSRSVRLEEEDTGAPRLLSRLLPELAEVVEELVELPVLPPSRLSSAEEPESPPSRLSSTDDDVSRNKR